MVTRPFLETGGGISKMKFKVGDKVTVFKPVSDEHLDWVSDMDNFIGKSFKIQGFHGDRYKIDGDDGDWTWTWKEEWLEDPVLRLINEVTRK